MKLKIGEHSGAKSLGPSDRGCQAVYKSNGTMGEWGDGRQRFTNGADRWLLDKKIL